MQAQATGKSGARGRARRWLWVLGPGLMVMLADTDAGSLITAAQSGAEWHYRMILPQLLLIPVLYMVQEITVRLGIVTGKGHGELIRQHFGPLWAYLSSATLLLSSVGGLVTEFVGIAATGGLFGIPPVVPVGAAALFLIGIGITGSYRRVERVGLMLGLFELIFVVVAVWAHPDWAVIGRDALKIPLANRRFLLMLSANIGAVIMPWMIFYQQGAVLDKGWGGRPEHLQAARWDTWAGSAVTQLIMVSMVVATAATIGSHGSSTLTTVSQIAGVLSPYTGHWVGTLLFGMGMLGASLIAALVISIAGSWGLGEVMGFRHSLNHRLTEAPWFYGLYAAVFIMGALVVLCVQNLVSLAIDVEVMNALLLPIVLGFLLLLEARALPAEHRMQGAHRYGVWALSAVVMVFGFAVVL